MRENNDPIGVYLNSVGSRPLLTPEEEIEFAKQARAYFELLEHPAASSGEAEWAKAAGLSVSELRGLLKRGERARNKLIECNLRLVVSIAKRHQNKGLPFHDLCQEGTLGLARAVEKFDPARGYRFSTYAYHWILQAINRAIQNTSYTIRLPVHVRETLSRLNKMVRLLSQKLGRRPRCEEIARELEISLDKLQDLIAIQNRTFCYSLEAPLRSKSGDLTLGDLLSEMADETPVVAEADIEILWLCLKSLPQRYRDILEYRYLDGLTLEECGERLGVSRGRARQIEARAKELAKPYLAGFKEF